MENKKQKNQTTTTKKKNEQTKKTGKPLFSAWFRWGGSVQALSLPDVSPQKLLTHAAQQDLGYICGSLDGYTANFLGAMTATSMHLGAHRYLLAISENRKHSAC